MKLQTKLPLQRSSHPIDYSSEILLLGSCFVENIGEKLDYYQFKSLQNPFGILYHIIGIEKLIERALTNRKFTEADLSVWETVWFSYEAHSKMSSANKIEVLDRLNDAVTETKQRMENASHIILTLGTSWVYRLKSSNQIVSNCHKVPNANFSKELLPIDTLKDSIERSVEMIRAVNNKCSIIFTISPIRHIRNGLVKNQRGKAHLVAALGDILEQSEDPGLHYFPSYELVLDELRDYRFYSEDLIHVNSLGVAYVWERFKNEWIDKEAYDTMEKVNSIRKDILHRPFDASSEKHKQFLSALEKKIMRLRKSHPYISFDR